MIEISPPRSCTNLAQILNSSDALMEGCESMTFSNQDRELASIFKDLYNIDFTGRNTNIKMSRVKGCFCSGTVVNLIKKKKKKLTEAEIKVIEKDLDYAPI